MRKKTEKIVFVLFILFLVIYYLIEWKKDSRISSRPAQTTGVIIDYYVIFPQSHYLEYEYKVSGLIYTKRVPADKVFKDCEKNKECIGLRFLVIYEYKNPSNSRIDLNQPR